MTKTTSFLASSIIIGDELQVLNQAALNAVAGRILSIGAPLPGAEIVDLGHALLSPLFIDAHCHLGDTGAKEIGIGLPLEDVVVPPHGLKHRFLARLDAETHQQHLHHGLKEMLDNGIIACADFREQGPAGVKALREAAQGLPIRVFALGRMAETDNAADIYSEAVEIFKIADGLGIRDVESYPAAVIKELRAQFPDKIFALHVSESTASEKASQQTYGRGQTARALELSPDLLVHLTHTPSSELAQVAAARVKAVCCPRSNGILGDGLPDVSAWVQAGVDFSIGSDNMMISSPDMFREMDYLSRMMRGYHQDPAAIDTCQIFSAATLQGARALKIAQDLGSLAPGKEASFMVLDLESPNFQYVNDYLSAMVHRAATSDIRNIFIKGEKYK